MNIRVCGRTLPKLVLLTAAVNSAWAVTIPNAADTYVSTATPTSNFGTQTSVKVAPGTRALVTFDVAGAVPAG